MLTLTENASTIVKTITAQNTGTEEAGLRITGENSPGGLDFAVGIVPAPEPADEIVEAAGARVFLAEDAAVALSDKVLDAQVDEAGAVRFAVSVQ